MIKRMMGYIHRNRVRLVLIQCLLVVSFFLMILVLMDTYAYLIQRDKNEKLYKYNTEEICRFDVIHINEKSFEKVGVGINDLKEHIRSDLGMAIGAYYETTEEFDELGDNHAFVARNKSLLKGTYEENFADMAKTIFLDPQLVAIIECGLNEEMFYPKQVGGQEYLPIYAGSVYEGIFALGDIFTLSRTGDKYVFCGYIEPINWFGFNPIEEPPRQLDNYFFAPFCDKEKVDSMTQLSTTSGIYAWPFNHVSDFSEQMIECSSVYGVSFKVNSVKDIILNWENNVEERLGPLKKLTITVIICSVLSIMSLLSVSVLLDKKEIGIRIAYGSSKANIFWGLQTSLTVQVVTSLIIAVLLVVYEVENTRGGDFTSIYYMAMRYIGIPVASILVLIISIIASMIPLAILKMYEPAELVKQQ